MTDLTKGLLEINGFTFNPQTTLRDAKMFFGDRACIREYSSGPNLRLTDPFYISSNIYAYSFDFTSEGLLGVIHLIPVAPPMIKGSEVPEYKFSVAKDWLASNIPTPATEQSKTYIYYGFDSVQYEVILRTDMHYGVVGGDIAVIYRED